jgi:hypothetical protein
MNKQTSVLHYQKAAQADISAATLKSVPFALDPRMTLSDAEVLFDMHAKYPEIKGMDHKAIMAFIARRQSEIGEESAQIKDKRSKLARLEEKSEAFEKLARWSSESGLKIERPEGPAFKNLRRAVAEGRSICLSVDSYAETDALAFEKDVCRYVEIMVVEHDWAALVNDADTERAEVRLPFDVCAFEFKFSGHRVVAIATQIDTNIVFCPAVQFNDIWLLPDFVVPLGGFEPDDSRNSCMVELLAELSDQIRAACIVLDAEVAVSEVVREPYAGTGGKGIQQPLKPYHVVSLANRRPRLPSTGHLESGRRVRLHFRRGHWRHFEDHKTWIKWMLVGNPDLGFVDKEYRL